MSRVDGCITRNWPPSDKAASSMFSGSCNVSNSGAMAYRYPAGNEILPCQLEEQLLSRRTYQSRYNKNHHNLRLVSRSFRSTSHTT